MFRTKKDVDKQVRSILSKLRDNEVSFFKFQVFFVVEINRSRGYNVDILTSHINANGNFWLFFDNLKLFWGFYPELSGFLIIFV